MKTLIHLLATALIIYLMLHASEQGVILLGFCLTICVALWCKKLIDFMMNQQEKRFESERKKFYQGIKRHNGYILQSYYEKISDLNSMDFENLSEDQKRALRRTVGYQYFKICSYLNGIKGTFKGMFTTLIIILCCCVAQQSGAQVTFSFTAALTKQGPAQGVNVGYKQPVKYKDGYACDFINVQFSGFTNNGLPWLGNDLTKYPEVTLYQAGYSKYFGRFECMAFAGAAYITIDQEDKNSVNRDHIGLWHWDFVGSARCKYNLHDDSGPFIGVNIMKDKMIEAGFTLTF